MSSEPYFPRIAVFTHDTFGLGHVQRCCRIIHALAEKEPEAAMLLITGSPVLHVFRSLPKNADYLKIPTIVRTGSEGSQPSHLPFALPEISYIRQNLINQAVEVFQPDVFLVDNFPLGSRRELLPTLQWLKTSPTHTILGLRDILDAPEVIRSDWERHGIYEVLADYYDSILVYGMREVMDIADAYSLPTNVADKVRYCGYVTAVSPPCLTAEQVRRELEIEGRFILATVGGGGDGLPLLETLVKASGFLPEDVSTVIVTGPLMGSLERSRLRQMASNQPRSRILEYVEDMTSYMAAADVVVSMGGYNTTAEIIALRPKAIIAPRTWRFGEHQTRADASLEWEQLLRAQALSRLGIADLLEPEALGPHLLAERICEVLNNPRQDAPVTVDLGGLGRVADHILVAARGAEGARHVYP